VPGAPTIVPEGLKVVVLSGISADASYPGKVVFILSAADNEVAVSATAGDGSIIINLATPAVPLTTEGVADLVAQIRKTYRLGRG
jgi:hypothetical protein